MKYEKDTKMQATEIERLREEKAVLLRWIGDALSVLATLEGEDSEDGGEELRTLLTNGKRMVELNAPNVRGEAGRPQKEQR